MLFLACSDDATGTAVHACVGEKKGVKNLLCVCVTDRLRQTLEVRRKVWKFHCVVCVCVCVCVCVRARARVRVKWCGKEGEGEREGGANDGAPPSPTWPPSSPPPSPSSNRPLDRHPPLPPPRDSPRCKRRSRGTAFLRTTIHRIAAGVRFQAPSGETVLLNFD